MQAEARARLSDAQLELVRSLAGQGSLPEGFDRTRIAAATEALRLKRARAVAGSWPALACALGEGFDERFARYAQENSIPLKGGPLADGRLFARALEQAGEFPDEAILEKLAFDVRYASASCGYSPRRGLSIRAAIIKRPLRFIMVVRHSLFGERWLNSNLSLFQSAGKDRL